MSRRSIESRYKPGRDCRWEKSKWPHPKFPQQLKTGLLPDVIWIRFHIVFRGEMMEEVTGWSSTKPTA